MIVLFTDFGLAGPYAGQVKAVLYRDAPGVPVVDLFADAPAGNPKAAAYLLAAYGTWFAAGTVFLCVIDPGVGGERPAVVVEADGRMFVGPGNGLFEIVVRRARRVRTWQVTWQPPRLSATFHGRDLFAPVAARIARGEEPPGEPRDTAQRIDRGWAQDYAHIIYLDHFGNALTGIHAAGADPRRRLDVGGRAVSAARTYSDVAPGEAFWYANANGLVEIAVNRGNAGAVLGLKVGDPVTWDRGKAGLRTKD